MKFSCNGFQAVRMHSLYHLHVERPDLVSTKNFLTDPSQFPPSHQKGKAEAEGSSPFVPPYSKIHCLVTAQELGWPAASKNSETR